MNEHQRILQAFQHGQQIGQRMALATVVRTRGSVYRRPGARMLLTAEGQMVSAISGGCLESDVLERARSLLAEGGSSLLVRYDTTASEDIVFGLGLGCNGVVEVLIESLNEASATCHLSFIADCLEKQQMGAIATIFAVAGASEIELGSRLMVKSDGRIINQIVNSAVAQKIAADAHKTLTEKKNQIHAYHLPQGQIEVFIEVIRPPVPLLVFGAGYDAIPVVQFAKQLGWHVTVIDSRSSFLTHDRFPLADQLLCCNPDDREEYQHLLTAQTVAVVMTHRYLSDLSLLKTLIPSRLRYLGVLGPKQRMQQLLQDLVEQQDLTLDPQQRLYNPVGLDIAAETPEEIALSIVAEIQAVLGGRSAGFLRDRVGPIHSGPESSYPESPCLVLAS